MEASHGQKEKRAFGEATRVFNVKKAYNNRNTLQITKPAGVVIKKKGKKKTTD